MASKPNVRHSSEQPRWGTNPLVVRIAQHVLGPGEIYVDPFSEPEYNALVGATRILTGAKGLDGFRDRWIDVGAAPRADQVLAGYPIADPGERAARHFTALVNPPGDESGDNVKNAWRILDALHQSRWIDSAIWVAFNLNQMQTLQGIAERHPLHGDFVRCVPSSRLPFVAHSSKAADPLFNDAPSHPCFFFLLPSHDEVRAAEQMRLFDSMSAPLGAVF